MLRSWMLAAVAGFSLSFSSQILYAQTTPSPEEQALRQRVEDLERKLKQLEDRLEQQAQPGPATGAAPAAAAEAAKPPQEEAMQKQIDELRTSLEWIDRLELRRQTTSGMVTFTLALEPSAALKK